MYANWSDVKDIRSVMLISWKVCWNGGCRNEVIRMLDIIEKGFVGSICGVAELR